jgi:cell division protein FtsL
VEVKILHCAQNDSDCNGYEFSRKLNIRKGACVMAANAARALDYESEYFFGSAAPAREIFDEPAARPVEIPIPQERTLQRQKARAAAAARNVPGISLFAVFGSLFAAVLMVFVVLAQISYNEAAAETVRLNARLQALTEQQRRLEITYENVIDMNAIERYAEDVLGMSKPEADQIAIVKSMPYDRAEVIDESDNSLLDGLGSFISSLMKYFK